MSELYLNGWVRCGEDGTGLYENRKIINSKSVYYGINKIIAESVADFADECDDAILISSENGLGELHSLIKNVRLQIFVTDKKCTLEEAKLCLLYKLDGYCQVDIYLVGYSEYTITGMDVDKFIIGNHDVESILSSYDGKYMHFLLACEKHRK